MSEAITSNEVNDACFPATSVDGQARQQALLEYADVSCAPTAVVEYTSWGKLLVVGLTVDVLAVRGQLTEEQLTRTTLLFSDASSHTAVDQDLPPTHTDKHPRQKLSAQQVELHGYLGQFQCHWHTHDDAGRGQEVFDFVLDLSDPPLIDTDLPPIGYFAPQHDASRLQHALDSLPTLVGTFEKPQYFGYDPDICAHGRSGITACRHCLDTCPTQAIISLGDQIQVDPHLCQGAGSCAMACPSGAIRYAYPNLADTLTRLRRMLTTYRQAGGQQAVVLFHDSASGQDRVNDLAAQLPESVLPCALEELGSVGMEVWISTLAYGANEVWLLLTDDIPQSVVVELDRQLAYARDIFAGMGYHAERLQRVTTDDMLNAFSALRKTDQDIPAASFAGEDEKRSMLRIAVDHLYQHAPVRRGFVSLGAGAPFGEASVDAGRCTLCMACVSQCPGNALRGGSDAPQLTFVEANCMQCGLCCRSCPEDAISITPRYLYDFELRRKPRLLHEEAPFSCIVCGKPFATQSVIRRITGQLQAHPMFQGTALQRLKMCEDCRVKADFQQHLNENDVISEEET